MYRLKACAYVCILFPNVSLIREYIQNIFELCLIYHLLSGMTHACLCGSQKSHLSFLTLSSITSSLALYRCAKTPFIFTESKFSASILLRYFRHFLWSLAGCGFQGRQQGERALMTLPCPWFENMADRCEEMETHDCLQSESFKYNTPKPTLEFDPTWVPGAYQSHSITPLFNWTGERKYSENSQDEGKERSLTNSWCCKTELEEIN